MQRGFGFVPDELPYMRIIKAHILQPETRCGVDNFWKPF
jgi:hypothetical protein